MRAAAVGGSEGRRQRLLGARPGTFDGFRLASKPRMQTRSLLLSQLDPPQPQTAVMRYDLRRLGQFGAPSAFLRLPLAISGVQRHTIPHSPRLNGDMVTSKETQ
jgi:hypothetical protein